MPASTEIRSRLARLTLTIVLLVFMAGLFPLTADYVLFHPDERHYVDAGIGMVETGDYLTPRTPDGELRLKKPILPYWCTAVGFRAVGISPLGARLGFLIAGAAIVWLAWWGGLMAFGSRRAACFAAAVAMTQPALLISAPRTMPDVLLALGIQLSACGFLAVERHARATWSGLLAAFGGGAVAVLSKGLPGLAFLGFALLFTAWRRPALLARDWNRWVVAIGGCVIIGGSWFAAMAGLHADELVQQFTHDQVGRNRFARHTWQALAQLPMCVGWVGLMSAPWLLSVATELRSREFRAGWRQQPGVALLLGWGLMYCVLAAMINHVTPRYLLPVAAPLSILIGGLLHRADAAELQQRLWKVLPVGGVLIAVCCGVAGMQLVDHPAWLLLAVLSGLATNVAASHRVRRWSAVGQGLAIAAAVHITLFGAGLGLSWRRDGGIGALVARQMQVRDAARFERIVFGGEAAHAAQIRVTLGDRLDVEPYAAVQLTKPGDLLVLDGECADVCRLPQHRVATASCGYRNIQAGDFFRAVLTGRLSEYLAECERTYVFAIPDNQERHGATQTAAATGPVAR